MNLSKLIGFDFKSGQYTIGGTDPRGNKIEASEYSEADVDAFLAGLAKGGAGAREQHELLAQAIIEPIEQVLPYQEIYNRFWMEQTLGELEDNPIPVEDVVALAWETHQDGQILYTRCGFSWTRPSFVTFDTGIEVPWAALRKAGWNFLARQMRRATEALARKRDTVARNTLIAAIPASHEYNVTGGSLTKAIIDSVLKDQAAIGFPVQQAIVNPSTLMDMGAFTWGSTGFTINPEDARKLLRTLYLMDYGGVQWYTNPFVDTTEVIFAGSPDQVGVHQKKGPVITSSDVNITRGVDQHAIRDCEHAYYVGSTLTLARIRIGA